MKSSFGSQAAPGAGTDRPTATAIASLVAQLLPAGVVIWLYGVEGQLFFRLFVVAAAGFAATLCLPMTWRLPLFALLPVIAVFLVFDVVDGVWLLSCGPLLIGLCHLPNPVFGGYGYMTEQQVECDPRDSVGSTLYSGTSEIQRNIIARGLKL